jgi:hypothetical protein
METLQIDILKPKAKKFLEELASQNLISIRSADSPFQTALKKIGVPNQESIPSEEEILIEVGEERTARYKRQHDKGHP